MLARRPALSLGENIITATAGGYGRIRTTPGFLNTQCLFDLCSDALKIARAVGISPKIEKRVFWIYLLLNPKVHGIANLGTYLLCSVANQ